LHRHWFEQDQLKGGGLSFGTANGNSHSRHQTLKFLQSNNKHIKTSCGGLIWSDGHLKWAVFKTLGRHHWLVKNGFPTSWIVKKTRYMG
jgi:hypothetical protein